jgi:hypothetical protein
MSGSQRGPRKPSRWRLFWSNRPYASHERKARVTAVNELVSLANPQSHQTAVFSDEAWQASAIGSLVPVLRGQEPVLTTARHALVTAVGDEHEAATRTTNLTQTIQGLEEEIESLSGAGGEPDPSPSTAPVHVDPAKNPDLIDLDTLHTERNRRWRRRLAQLADGAVVLFDELYFVSSYLIVTGTDLENSAGWKIALNITGGVFLGLISPIVVIMPARVLAAHLARWRAGMLELPSEPTASSTPAPAGRWRRLWAWLGRVWRVLRRHTGAALSALIMIVTSIALAILGSARIASSQDGDQRLLSAMEPALVMLFAVLPWVIMLAHYFAENPKADRLEAAREEVKKWPLTRLAQARAALAEAERELAGVQRAEAEARSRITVAWTDLYTVVHNVVSEVEHFMVEARHLSLGVRALVTWPLQDGANLTEALRNALEERSVDLSALEPYLKLLEQHAGTEDKQEISALRVSTKRFQATLGATVAQTPDPSANGNGPDPSSHITASGVTP